MLVPVSVWDLLVPRSYYGGTGVLGSPLHEFESNAIVIIFFVVFLPFLLVTWKEYPQRDQTTEKLDAALLWATFKENKKVCAVTVWLLICCAVVIGSRTSSPAVAF